MNYVNIKNPINTKDFGNYAEDVASYYLESNGYEILTRNYRKPWGEIDIIARKDSIVYFVEVKANRTNYASFSPELRVDARKSAKIVKAASLFIASEHKKDCEWQVDIIAVTFNNDMSRASIKHLKNIAGDIL
ncbi:MAG: putative endonuclease [Parcubacteria group bacterium Licking1014_17]|nr:MAG: putative endonuclease [Parcubacteria group bacterium Licking1014_17]